MESLISVIMPAYNAGLTILDSIESIQRQTFPHWELLIIDDGSNDDTLNKVRKLAKNEGRIRVFCQAKNVGAAACRNLGLTLAKGKFIAFCDADDLWVSEKLKVQAEQFQDNQVGVVYSSYRKFKDTCDPSSKVVGAPETGDFNQLTFSNYICMSSAAVRRDCLEGVLFPSIRMHEDYAFWLLLMKKPIEARGCAEPLVWYRENPHGISANKIRAARYHWMILREFTQLAFIPRCMRFGVYLSNGIAKHGFKKTFFNLG